MATTDTRYNGWANYPTWLILSTIINDEGMLDEAIQIATDPNITYMVDRDTGMREYVESDLPDSGMAADLIGWALGVVDWRAITNHLIEIAAEVK